MIMANTAKSAVLAILKIAEEIEVTGKVYINREF